MAQDGPVTMTFSLVGAARLDNSGLKLEDLAEHVAEALDNGQWVKLGFYDWGYPESVEFWPRKVEGEEGFQRTSMKAFSGEIGAPPSVAFPACLIISERDGRAEAVITWVIPQVRRRDSGED
jgi:hypothetical protein